jgi:hypothetical protein
MRLQLTLVAVTLGALAAPARADGTLVMRGVYYKERATRVMQPMLDAMFDVGTRGIATGHFLVDAITSASTSAGAIDAEPFDELRYEGGVGYSHRLEAITIAGNTKVSTEPDYVSLYAGARVQAELAQKNLVLGLGGGISHDTIRAAGPEGPSAPTLRCDAMRTSEPECTLDTYSVFASASQILSPNALLSVSVDISELRGYQANPYRQAIVGETLAAERHPTERSRQAFAASARYHVLRTHTTVIGAYRYYRDSWNVHAHTPELRVVQELGYDVETSLRYRYYTQDGAGFYRERYPADDAEMTQFVSDDVKLSNFTGHTFEAKAGVLGRALGLERWAEIRLEGILEYAIQHNRFGNAVVAHVALAIPFSY